MSNDNKERVGYYELDKLEFYLILRLLYSIEGREQINGLPKDFFENEPYQKSDKILKKLKKKKIITESNGDIAIASELKSVFDVILNSSKCMTMRNAKMQKNETILTFYYFDGQYVGMCIDKNVVKLSIHETEEGVCSAFATMLTANAVSPDFSADNWKTLCGDNFERSINKPKKVLIIHEDYNALAAVGYTGIMIADGYDLQYTLGCDIDSEDREYLTLPADYYYGVILKQLERLKDTGNVENSDSSVNNTTEYTDFERYQKTSGMPKNGASLIWWIIKKFFKSIPGYFKGMVKRRIITILVYLLWLIVGVGFINLFATCYLNNTFFFDRNQRWGDWTPYLFGGSLRTPSNIKGFNMNWGTISTAFLAGPLFGVFTLLIQHILVQIKNNKLKCFTNIGTGIKNFPLYFKDGYWNKKAFYITLICVFVLSFVVMNPITIGLLTILALLIYFQGDRSDINQFVFLNRCAWGYKKIEAGKVKQPTMKNSVGYILYLTIGLAIYSILNVLLWNVFAYSFWMRLLVTIFAIGFCVLQLCTTKKQRAAAVTALIPIALMVGMYMLNLITLADDGGWVESGGTITGLIANAGFSIIAGISVATIMVAAGATGAWLLIPAVAATGMFAASTTDTVAGAYISKSAKQFFQGPKEGDSTTLLCAGVQAADFVAGFMNPAAGVSSGWTTAYRVGRVSEDAIMGINDAVNMGYDIHKISTGELSGKDAIFTMAMDTAGLGFDAYGTYGDVGDLKKAWNNHFSGNKVAYDGDGNILKIINDNKNAKEAANNAYVSNRIDERSRVQEQFNNRMDAIDADIRRNLDLPSDAEGTIRGLSPQESIDQLNRASVEAGNIRNNANMEIDERLQRQLKDDIAKANEKTKEDLVDTLVGDSWHAKTESISENVVAPTLEKVNDFIDDQMASNQQQDATASQVNWDEIEVHDLIKEQEENK